MTCSAGLPGATRRSGIATIPSRSLLVALGFSIWFGVFVAAFVMATSFPPALTALIGHAAWWPGHGDEKREPEKEPQTV